VVKVGKDGSSAITRAAVRTQGQPRSALLCTRTVRLRPSDRLGRRLSPAHLLSKLPSTLPPSPL